MKGDLKCDLRGYKPVQPAFMLVSSALADVSNSDLIAVTAGVMSNVSLLCLVVLSLSKADLFLKRFWTSSAR